MNQPRNIRRRFYKALLAALHVVWPVLSAVFGLIALLGIIVAEIEAWPPMDGVYFAFVTALTVGYGDLAPTHALSRILAIAIGFAGILLTGLFAAIAVRAMQAAIASNPPHLGQNRDSDHRQE